MRYVCVAVMAMSAWIHCAPAFADQVDSVDLVVDAGRPLRVALDSRVRIKQVGQAITGTLVEPLYVYDREVIPIGASVVGHVERLENPPKLARIGAFASGNFSPNRHVVLKFDSIRMADGQQFAIQTTVGPGIEHVTLQVAAQDHSKGDESDESKTGLSGRARAEVARAKQEATDRARAAVRAIKSPGKFDRLKTVVIEQLPYHPQFLAKGSVYNAELLTPLDFGSATVVPFAEDSTPAPESILTARLAAGIDSATSTKGTPIKAVLAEPVFSANHELILPQGAELTGQVTFVRKARHFRHNGQLRFLFESVTPPNRDSTTMLASLYSVQVSAEEHVEVDEEGGARATNSNTRFIAPALALMSLRGSFRERRGLDGDRDDSLPARPGGSPGALGVGGFFGWGLAGTALSLASRPAGIALSVVGAARAVYGAFFAKGREVSFPADTPIQVQLAPGPRSRS